MDSTLISTWKNYQKLQKIYKLNYIARKKKELTIVKKKRKRAAIMIQSCYRGFILRISYNIIKNKKKFREHEYIFKNADLFVSKKAGVKLTENKEEYDMFKDPDIKRIRQAVAEMQETGTYTGEIQVDSTSTNPSGMKIKPENDVVADDNDKNNDGEDGKIELYKTEPFDRGNKQNKNTIFGHGSTFFDRDKDYENIVDELLATKKQLREMHIRYRTLSATSTQHWKQNRLDRLSLDRQLKLDKQNTLLLEQKLEQLMKESLEQKKISKPEEKCCICMNECKNKTCTLECGHIFHTNCIFKWFNKNNNCPICRAEVPELKKDNDPPASSRRVEYFNGWADGYDFAMSDTEYLRDFLREDFE